jgi:hypothetical protein
MREERACYFVVAKIMGRSTPMIFWDELPKAPIRHLEYVLRLDVLPTGVALVNASLKQLFATYLALKMRGELPPRWEPPKPKTPEATVPAVATADGFT